MSKAINTLILGCIFVAVQSTTAFAMQPQEETPVQRQDKSTFTKISRYALFEIAIPSLLRSNKYTHYTVYPYTWWYKGKREAVNLVILDSIMALAEKATKNIPLVNNHSQELDDQIKKLAVTYATTFLINRYVSQPLTSIILDENNN